MNKEDLLSKMLDGELAIDKVLAHLEEEAKRNAAADLKRRQERNKTIAACIGIFSVHLSLSAIVYMLLAFLWTLERNEFRWWMPRLLVVLVAANIFIAAMNYLDAWPDA